MTGESLTRPKPLERICVYCGSSPGHNPVYLQCAIQLGHLLAERDIELVYGGSCRGLMGRIADTVLESGGRVTGVIPQGLVDLEIAHHGLTQIHVVNSMHERKARMVELADAFIALPGAWGTLDELCEGATWAQLGLHSKPIGLWNINGYWNSFLAFLQTAVAEGFLKPEHCNILLVSSTLPELIGKLEAARTEPMLLPGKL